MIGIAKKMTKMTSYNFFFIFTFNENLNLQIGVTYTYKISSKLIDNQKSATYYQKRLKKKETINFKNFKNLIEYFLSEEFYNLL